MSGDGAPATAADLRDRVRLARQEDRVRLEAEAGAAMQGVAAAMTKSSEELLDTWTTSLRGSLSATATRVELEADEASSMASRQIVQATRYATGQIDATTAEAVRKVAAAAKEATRQIEAAARSASESLYRLDREAEQIGRASRRLARWPLILAALAGVAILAAALWARAAILPDTSMVTRPDGTTVTVLEDPGWAACPEGLCKTTTTTTGG